MEHWPRCDDSHLIETRSSPSVCPRQAYERRPVTCRMKFFPLPETPRTRCSGIDRMRPPQQTDCRARPLIRCPAAVIRQRPAPRQLAAVARLAVLWASAGAQPFAPEDAMTNGVASLA